MDARKDGAMQLKWIGAICVFASCCGWGLLAASRHRMKISALQQFISVLNFMICELQYRTTPLPQLCRLAGEQRQGNVKQVFMELARELDAQISPDAQRCMAAVLDRHCNLPIELRGLLGELGNKLGKFNLLGQVRALEDARNGAMEQLGELKKNKDERLRSYQTLGLCAGAAIAILLV